MYQYFGFPDPINQIDIIKNDSAVWWRVDSFLFLILDDVK